MISDTQLFSTLFKGFTMCYTEHIAVTAMNTGANPFSFRKVHRVLLHGLHNTWDQRLYVPSEGRNICAIFIHICPCNATLFSSRAARFIFIFFINEWMNEWIKRWMNELGCFITWRYRKLPPCEVSNTFQRNIYNIEIRLTGLPWASSETASRTIHTAIRRRAILNKFRQKHFLR